MTADRVIIGGRDKRLHCIDRATGKGVWTFQTRGQVDSSPVICGDAIIVGSEDGRLYCVNLADGKERWAYEIGAAVTASPGGGGWPDRHRRGGRQSLRLRRNPPQHAKP